MSNSLLEKIKSIGVKSDDISKSELLQNKDIAPTDYPIINTAFTGQLDGGIMSGITIAAGPSRHFKSLLGLVCVAAYMKKHADAVVVFYDSEFGITNSYLTQIGIDTSRVLHIPIEDIEQLKFDITQKLDGIKRGERVFFFIDSIGNLASRKEIEDALDSKSVADMTRSKALKSLFRIITPKVALRDVPVFAISHTYQTMEMFSKEVVSGGRGGMYAGNTVFIIGRQQEKDGDELVGYNFTLNIEKSRYIKEKSKLTFTVRFEGGIDRYSGLFDLALESGDLVKDGKRYRVVDMYTGEITDKIYFRKNIPESFYEFLIKDEKFNKFVTDKYRLPDGFVATVEDNLPDDDDDTEETSEQGETP